MSTASPSASTRSARSSMTSTGPAVVSTVSTVTRTSPETTTSSAITTPVVPAGSKSSLGSARTSGPVATATIAVDATASEAATAAPDRADLFFRCLPRRFTGSASSHASNSPPPMTPNRVPTTKPPMFDVGRAMTAKMIASTPRWRCIAGRIQAVMPSKTRMVPMTSVETPDTVEIITRMSATLKVK